MVPEKAARMNPGAQNLVGQKIRRVWTLTDWLRWTAGRVKTGCGDRKLGAYTSEELQVR